MHKVDLELLVNNIAVLDKASRLRALTDVFNIYGSEVYKSVQSKLVEKLK
jgi:hypothetical protein